MYNNEVLDMFEMVLLNHEEFTNNESVLAEKLKHIDFTFKTTFLSFGDIFEEDKEMEKLRNSFNDYFHANEEQAKISLNNVFKVVVVMIGLPDKKFSFKFYSQKNSELVSIFPTLKFQLHRTFMSDDQTYKNALTKPKLTKSSAKLKNLEGNKKLGEVYGRVHVRQQDLKSLKLRFSKKIKKAQK